MRAPFAGRARNPKTQRKSLSGRIDSSRQVRPIGRKDEDGENPEVAARIGAMIADGCLEIVAGKIVEVAPNDQGADVALRRRGSQTVETLAVARIIICKGLTSDPDKSANPLVASLFANGLARADPLRIGIEVAPDCAVVDREGRPSPRLFAIGPMSQATFWEIIAVPDIRLQTAALAARLIAY
jgi:uncharacterized NAD(P)/FAD-binding protein YdhS